MNALAKVMSCNAEPVHLPVLLGEALDALAPTDGGVYVDCTFGAGGYSQALLAAAPCQVIGIDRDPDAVAAGHALSHAYDGRLKMLEGRFGDLEAHLKVRGVEAVDGVVFDLGVSSPQLDQADRGFSFRYDAALDMRMEQQGRTAADVVNSLPEGELAKIIFEYGEERMARRVARAIGTARAERPITRTSELADIVRRTVPRSFDGIDPATRTFQAIRVYVNNELAELERGLAAAERVLKPGGRLVVVAFHSLEDRIVKDFLRRRAIGAPAPSRHMPPQQPCSANRLPSFTLLTRRPVGPTEAEVATNPRARSARLRAAERTHAPAITNGARDH